MIDVDGGFYCEACYHCVCNKCDAKGIRNRPGILGLLEHELYNECTTRQGGPSIEAKCAWFVQRLAERAGVPIYKLQLHLNKARNDDDFILVPDPVRIATLTEIVKITKQCIHPIEDSPVDLTLEQFEDWVMEDMCDKHEEVCNHPTGKRWDRVLRRDVLQKQTKKASA